MTMPSTALFVAADEPLLVFSSIPEAEQYLEAIDVQDGVYSAVFGPRGEAFSINAEHDCVVIEPTNGSMMPEDVKRLLLHYLKDTGRGADESEPLDALVAKVWAIKTV